MALLMRVEMSLYNFKSFSSCFLSNNIFCDCNETRTHNYLVPKQMSVRLRRTKWLWVRVSLESLNLEILRLF